MLVRWRPTVFVSSAIDGLEDLRERVYEEIRALHLADAWLFEFHAVAAGSPPEDQYLAAARSCDVFVLLVGDEARPGTIAEYEVAVADNPAKVLPFVYGAATASSAELRARLRDSHAYKRLRSLEELSGVVAGAVGAYLETGSIARPGLLTRLEERRATGRVFLGLPAGFGFERELSGGGHHLVPALLASVGESRALQPVTPRPCGPRRCRSTGRPLPGSSTTRGAGAVPTVPTGAPPLLIGHPAESVPPHRMGHDLAADQA